MCVFEADGSSTYRAHLHGLPADYDLEVFDEDGKEVGAPHERGKREEEVRGKLPAGRYYLRIAGYQGAWSERLPYRLKLSGPETEGE